MAEARVPHRLRRGDKIAVLSPAGPVRSREGLEAGMRRLRTWGLRPELMPHATGSQGYLSAADSERLHDLRTALDDPETRAIWATRGGYGCMRILPDIDWSRLRRDPIPLVGFSDLTALLAAAWKEAGVIGFHGPMLAHGPDMAMGEDCETLQRLLISDTQNAPALPRVPGDAPRALRAGTARGPLVGGNLTMMVALAGTPWEIDTAGALVFLEEVNEAPYRVDRMLTQLRIGGWLDRAAGVVLGDFHLEGSPAGSTSPEIVRVFESCLGDLRAPVAYGFPFGHRPKSWTLPFGGGARLVAEERGAALELAGPMVR